MINESPISPYRIKNQVYNFCPEVIKLDMVKPKLEKRKVDVEPADPDTPTKSPLTITPHETDRCDQVVSLENKVTLTKKQIEILLVSESSENRMLNVK